MTLETSNNDELLKLLPHSFDCEIESCLFINKNRHQLKFQAELVVGLENKERAKEWVKEFSRLTQTNWILCDRNLWKSKKYDNAFSEIYVCHHSMRRKVTNSERGSANCSAKMTIKFTRDPSARKRKKLDDLTADEKQKRTLAIQKWKRGLHFKVCIQFDHSHNIADKSSLRFLRSQATGSETVYVVESSSNDQVKYTVDSETGACDCADSSQYGNWCKHATAVFLHYGRSTLLSVAATDNQKLKLMELALGNVTDEDRQWLLLPHIPDQQLPIASNDQTDAVSSQNFDNNQPNESNLPEEINVTDEEIDSVDKKVYQEIKRLLNAQRGQGESGIKAVRSLMKFGKRLEKAKTSASIQNICANLGAGRALESHRVGSRIPIQSTALARRARYSYGRNVAPKGNLSDKRHSDKKSKRRKHNLNYVIDENIPSAKCHKKIS